MKSTLTKSTTENTFAKKAFPTTYFSYQHRVSYGETDCMGVVYYGEYLHIFERARSEFIRNAGMSYTTIEAKGVMLPVREANCRYIQFARYDDLLDVRTVVSEWKKASLIFSYEIHNQNANTANTLVAIGFTQHACINQQGKPVALPDWFKELFAKNQTTL